MAMTMKTRKTTTTSKRFLVAALAVAALAARTARLVSGFSIGGGRGVLLDGSNKSYYHQRHRQGKRLRRTYCNDADWCNSKDATFFAGITTTRRTKRTGLSRLQAESTTTGLADHHDGGDQQQTSSSSLNEWHAELSRAVERQDFVRAAALSHEMSDRLQSVTTSLSWKGQGVAMWLVDRLSSLSFGIPTTIQLCSLEAVNRALRLDATNAEDGNYRNNLNLEELKKNGEAGARSTEHTKTKNNKNLGVVISGTTGAGKTLGYLVPLLSTLSEALFLRQRWRISDEEAVGDTAGDLADRITVVTSPTVSSSRVSGGNNNRKTPIAIGASLGRSASMGRNVRSPLALIVVPSRELGVQTAKLLYRLVGGSFHGEDDHLLLTNKNNNVDEDDDNVLNANKPASNKKKYKGPKGVKIATVLDDDDAIMGLKLQTDIAITTPKYLAKLIRDGDINPHVLRVIAIDEADLSLEQLYLPTTSTTTTDNVGEDVNSELSQLFAETTSRNKNDDDDDIRLTFLVGASVTESLGSYAVSSKILPEGTSYIATATSVAPLTRQRARQEQLQDTANAASSRQVATFQDLNVCLHPDLQHERVIVPVGSSNLLVLTRLLRNELRAFDNEGSDDNVSADPSRRQRPRVVVFFPDEKTARAAIAPLRDALWGEHRLCVLLPTEGVMPLTIMEQFKRNETTVMLATPNSVRGLDFPALTHVYATYCCGDDPREYLHLAGRVGRIGHATRGRVISVLSEADGPQLDALAATLGFTFQDLPAPTGETIDIDLADDEDDEDDDYYYEEDKIVQMDKDTGGDKVEKLRRFLEDKYALMDDDETTTEDLSSQ